MQGEEAILWLRDQLTTSKDNNLGPWISVVIGESEHQSARYIRQPCN